MAFYGCDFIFDGKRASSFFEGVPNAAHKKLMVYNIGSYGQDDVDLSVGEIVEDRINRRYDSLLYGLVHNEPLQFTLVFGIDPDVLTGEMCLNRIDVARVAEWLTGHREYKILEIDQPDMLHYRFHAMVTGLKVISDGGLPVAFSAEITCDSPFAYNEPVTYRIDMNSEMNKPFRLDNQSMTNWYYYPVLEIELDGASYIQFENTADGGRIMLIENIPSDSGQVIRIDCQNQIITDSLGYNLYPGFNMRFLRLVPGENNINISTDGVGEVRTTCEFPMNLGA